MSSRLRLPVPSAEDRALLAAFAQAGDQAAFARLVDRHGPLVLGVCRRVLRDAHLADDAFQAVFLVLARKAATVRVGPSLANYLFAVARRVALAARRGERRRAARAEKVAQQGANAPRSPDWDDLLLVLDEELARLPDKLRAPVIECFFRERTQDEAAKELGWSLSTFRRRLDRAKELLRARLTGRGATLGAGLIGAMIAVSPALATATLGSATGQATPAVLALAKAGVGASLGAKLGFAALALGVAVGVGFALWPAAPPARTVPVPAPQPPAETEVILPPRLVQGGPEVIPPPRFVRGPDPVVDLNWATIRGRIVWPAANPPELKRIEPNNDREHCESLGVLRYEDILVNAKNGGVKNVVVWLRPDTENRKDPFPADKIKPELAKPASKHHVIDQPCCQFVPRVLAARAGDTLEIKNSAPVPHNVNYNSDEESFNVTTPSNGSFKLTRPLSAQATPIPFKCDIHTWMQGRIRVFDHPYFAVTDADGNFEIKDAPVGKWRLVVWHEGGFHKGREGVLGWRLDVTGGVTELRPVALELPK